MKIFLDPAKPLSTCRENSCVDCNMNGRVFCHFTPKKLLVFLSLGIPLMVLCGICAFRFSAWVFAAWTLFVLSYFSVFEIRALCSHCPHYAEPELRSLKCWANYGSPKLWKYRPGPLKAWEKLVFIGGACLIFLFPIVAVAIKGFYLLAAVSALLFIVFLFVMRWNYCLRCMNFVCPFNCVPNEVRRCFFSHNPTIAKAWDIENK